MPEEQIPIQPVENPLLCPPAESPLPEPLDNPRIKHAAHSQSRF